MLPWSGLTLTKDRIYNLNDEWISAGLQAAGVRLTAPVQLERWLLFYSRHGMLDTLSRDQELSACGMLLKMQKDVLCGRVT